jgi:hypothetical protein
LEELVLDPPASLGELNTHATRWLAELSARGLTG